MSPLPELNLGLGMTKDPHSAAAKGDGEIIVRTNSGLSKHTISMVISDQELGKISLKIGEREIEIPTYKLTVTDDKTHETEAYQVTRDTLSFTKIKIKRNILSFLGFKKFDKTSYLYENIPFEPVREKMEKFDISRHRKLSQEELTYHLKNEEMNILLYAGNINDFKKPEGTDQYFIVVDQHEGKSFIGDILYREKFLKLTPKVELQIIRRKEVPKNFEYDEKGNIKRTIYL
ncbi:hypothetical protein VUJ46_20000 [Chryseobacterium sp. MYb264]|uniref:hypothetical protein n=1 Tax=Chryseobacterium sp. MYb264 TaxID=2745153 RepID=UPI002E14FD04|nr:hypothetical protein VUJ46_20000 [Chryseobacterium sp. MYb264]